MTQWDPGSGPTVVVITEKQTPREWTLSSSLECESGGLCFLESQMEKVHLRVSPVVSLAPTLMVAPRVSFKLAIISNKQHFHSELQTLPHWLL